MAAEPVRGLPRAELVVMQVCRLRPKSTEECRIETADIIAWTAYLRGEVPQAPGAPVRRWPVNLGFDYYLTPKGMILSCKARTPTYLHPLAASLCGGRTSARCGGCAQVQCPVPVILSMGNSASSAYHRNCSHAG